MSENQTNPTISDLSPDEKNTALFVQLVFQLSGLATMLLGQVPNPETGETKRDLETARMLIDQLEMLDAKTRGNLTPDEAQVLRQNLTSLRLAYVEAVEQPGKPAEPAIKDQPPSESTPPEEPAGDHDSKVKFTKKY